MKRGAVSVTEENAASQVWGVKLKAGSHTAPRCRGKCEVMLWFTPCISGGPQLPLFSLKTLPMLSLPFRFQFGAQVLRMKTMGCGFHRTLALQRVLDRGAHTGQVEACTHLLCAHFLHLPALLPAALPQLCQSQGPLGASSAKKETGHSGGQRDTIPDTNDVSEPWNFCPERCFKEICNLVNSLPCVLMQRSFSDTFLLSGFLLFLLHVPPWVEMHLCENTTYAHFFQEALWLAFSAMYRWVWVKVKVHGWSAREKDRGDHFLSTAHSKSQRKHGSRQGICAIRTFGS